MTRSGRPGASLGGGADAPSGAERPVRSVLFAPGSDRRKLAKVTTLGADLAAMDLEDAVADSAKEAARDIVVEALGSVPAGPRVAVRVNPADSELFEDDLRAVLHPRLDAVLLPKVETAEALVELDDRLRVFERSAGLDEGAVEIVGLIETALGLVRCEALAAGAPKRLGALVLGTADLAADLRLGGGANDAALLYARSRLVVVSRAARLLPPIDGPYLNIDDQEGLLADSQRSRKIGFGGRVALHPAQVGPVHAAYGASVGVEEAARIVEAFEAAQREGRASIRVGSQFVDYPIYRRARDVLDGAERADRGAPAGVVHSPGPPSRS